MIKKKKKKETVIHTSFKYVYYIAVDTNVY